MAKLTILLTGANGFLGSHLLEALLSQQYNVVILKRSTSDLWRIEHLMDQVASYDVDKLSLERAFKEQKIDCVIHTACHYGRNSDSISEVAKSNLIYGLEILDASLKSSVDTFINTDTFFNNREYAQEYLGEYTLSKKQFVEWLHYFSNKINIVNMKLQHVYGPKDDRSKFIPWVISQFKNDVDEIRLTKGDQERDFIYVDDVVNAYLVVLAKRSGSKGFDEYDVGTGNIQSVRSFLLDMQAFCSENYSMSRTKLVFGSLPEREGEIKTIIVNNSGLLKLGWSVTTNSQNAFKKIFNYKVD